MEPKQNGLYEACCKLKEWGTGDYGAEYIDIDGKEYDDEYVDMACIEDEVVPIPSLLRLLSFAESLAEERFGGVIWRQ
ncbi:MAG: hypothetical protein WC455_12075 [Dehalococcoidia bacterium]